MNPGKFDDGATSEESSGAATADHGLRRCRVTRLATTITLNR